MNARPGETALGPDADAVALFNHFVGGGSSVSRIVRPSDLAVFTLMTISYPVGTCTGRSAGFSPFRMRST
jgi:hypothetical protein